MKRPSKPRPKTAIRRLTYRPEVEPLEYRWYPGDLLVPLGWTVLAARFPWLFGQLATAGDDGPGRYGEYRRSDGINADSVTDPVRIAVLGEEGLRTDAIASQGSPAADPAGRETGKPVSPSAGPDAFVAWSGVDEPMADPLAGPWDAAATPARRHSGQAGNESADHGRPQGDAAAPVFDPSHAAADSTGAYPPGGAGSEGYGAGLGSWSSHGSSAPAPAEPNRVAPPGGQGPLTGSPPNPRWLGQGYAQLPLGFEPNRGQTASQVQFLARGQGYNLFLTATGTTVVLQKPVADGPTRAVLRLQLAGANPAAQGTGLDPLPGASNYLKGNDPRQWQTNVSHFGRVRYQNVYAGIDLAYYGNQRQVEFDFIVAPGASPAAVHLAFDGAGPLTLDPQGQLVLGTPGGTVLQRAPVIYQLANGVRQPVTGAYVLQGLQQAGFVVGPYDTSRPLYIDPVLSYSGYLGGSGDDTGNAIAVDAAGNAYIAGSTTSPNFPGAGGLQSYAGAQDAFVTKLDPTGSVLVYSTYLGGSAADEALGIAVDSAGNAYVTGDTASTDFPKANAYQTSLTGAQNAFVAKLNAAGNDLLYSTYLGGNGSDTGQGVAVDVAGIVYVAGKTSSTNFPTSTSAYQTAYGGGTSDAFVTKLDPTQTTQANQLLYSTSLGGVGADVARGVAVDASGRIYVTGSTTGSFPIVSAFQATYGGGTADAFVAKIDPSQSGSSSLVNSSYLGGGDLDEGWGIALDAANNAYVTGRTRSNNFTTTAGAYQTAYGGGVCSYPCSDAFVAKINFPASPGSATLTYSTYLGGTGDDEGKAIAVDAYGKAWITGSTTGNFPLTASATQSTFGGGTTDAFLSQLDAAGATLGFSTYLGGSGNDVGQGVAVDPQGNAYVTGLTKSSDFPLARALQGTLSGASDAFVSKFSPVPPPPLFTGITPITGNDPNARLTQNRQPTLLGQAVPNHNVKVTRDGLVDLGTVTAGPNGAWSLAGQPALSDGVHSFTATDQDPVTLSTSEPSREFLVTIDNAPPTVTLYVPATTYSLAPEVRVVASDLNGVPQDALGDYQVFLDVDLSHDGQYTGGLGYTTVPLHDGFADFLVKPSGAQQPLTVNSWPMRARVRDRAGNQGTSAVQTVTIQVAPTNWPVTAELRTWDPLTGDALLQSGDVHITHPLKLDQSPGQAMSLGAALVYNSDSVDLRPIIRAAIQSDNAPAVTLPDPINVQLTWDDAPQTPPPPFSTAGRMKGELLTVAAQVDSTAALTTGRHTWSLQITGTPVSEPTLYGVTYVVNKQSSPFGAGWTFSLVDQLMQIDAQSDYHNVPRPEGKLRIFGSGGWRFYQKTGPTTFQSPAGDNGTLVVSGTNYTYTTPDGTKWTFDSNGRQIRWADATADNLLTFSYDGNNRLYTMQAADNSLSTFSYDSGSGLLQSIAAPYGRQYSIGHTGTLLTQIQNADNGVRTVTYTNQTYPNTLTGEQIAGENRAWTYGSHGRLTTFTQGTGADTTITAITPAAVQGMGQMAAGDPQAVVTDGLNHTTKTNMDSVGRPTQQLAGDGGLTVWNRDGNGFVTSMIDPLGRTTTYVRDGQGDILQVQQPDSTSTTFVYDSAQGAPKRLTSFTNERNKTTTFGYYSYPTDAGRHINWTQDALSRYTTFTWDSAARMLASVMNPRNFTTSMTNDAGTRTVRAITRGLSPNDSFPQCWQLGSGSYQVTICPSDTAITTSITYAPTGPDYDPCFYRGQQWGNAHLTTLCIRYDAMGRPRDFRDGYQSANERRTTVLYDAAGKIISYTTGLGSINAHPVTVSFAYDTAGRRTKTIEGYGSPIRRQQLASYDAAGRLASVTDFLGHRQTYAYDGAGRVVATTDLPGYPRQRTATVVYDLAGNRVNAIDSLGRVTQWTYDSRNRPTQETDAVGLPEQRSTTMLYDGVGNVTSMTTGQGSPGYAQPATSNFIYDALDRVTGRVEAVGVSNLQRTATMVRDENGNVTSVTRAQTYDGAPTPTLVTTSYQYDRHDRPQLITEAMGAPEQRTTSVVYDATDNVSFKTTGIASSNAHQATSYFGYDELNRVTIMQEAIGDSGYRNTTMVYDLTDNLLYQTEGQGTGIPQPLQTAFRYDTLNRATQVTDAYGTSLARISQFSYDDLGEQTAYTDPLKQTTRIGYDELNRPTHRVDALGYLTRVDHDPADNSDLVVDPVANRWAYSFDGLNREAQEAGPFVSGQTLISTRTFTYDAADNLRKTTDRNVRETEYRYDPLNRTTNEIWQPGATPLRTMTYAYNATNDLTSAVDPDTNRTYQYDRLSRPITITQNPIAGLPSVVYNQTFDAADERINLTTTIGGAQDSVTAYVYDSLNRMTQIQQSGAASPKRVDMTYTALDKFNTIKLSSDLGASNVVALSTYVYDSAARLQSINSMHGATSLASYAYLYDAADRVTQLTTPDGVSSYAYDLTNQLTNVGNSTNPETYVYDAAGNRTMGAYSTGLGNRLSSDGVFTYSYDGKGNRVGRTKIGVSDVTTYTWDHRNRLTRVQRNGTELPTDTTYTYDVFDRRTSKANTTQTSRYVYDGAGIALAYSGAGSPSLSNRYLHGPTLDQLFADEQVTGGSSTTYWALSDQLGSVRDLVNSSGISVRHRIYDSFGKVTSSSGSGGVDTLFAFTGRELDAETGQQFHRERYYDPKVGRWLSEDPIGFAAGDGNLYRYVGNQPTGFSDPSGLLPCWQIMNSDGTTVEGGGANCAGDGQGGAPPAGGPPVPNPGPPVPSKNPFEKFMDRYVGDPIFKWVADMVGAENIAGPNKVGDGTWWGDVGWGFTDGVINVENSFTFHLTPLDDYWQDQVKKHGKLYEMAGDAADEGAGAAYTALAVWLLGLDVEIACFPAGTPVLVVEELESGADCFDTTAQGCVAGVRSDPTSWTAGPDYAMLASETGEPGSRTEGDVRFLTGNSTVSLSATRRRRLSERTKNIEEIEVGDTVMAFDLATGRWCPRQVLKTFERDYDNDLVMIIGGNDRIEATGNHPFWVTDGVDLRGRPNPEHAPAYEPGSIVDGRWVDARDLRVGDLLLQRSGETARVSHVSLRFENIKVYNFHVAGLHTYAVGNAQFLVHNRKEDIARIDQIAQQEGWDNEVRHKFGDFIEELKNDGFWDGVGPHDDLGWDRLQEAVKVFKEWWKL